MRQSKRRLANKSPRGRRYKQETNKEETDSKETGREERKETDTKEIERVTTHKEETTGRRRQLQDFVVREGKVGGIYALTPKPVFPSTIRYSSPTLHCGAGPHSGVHWVLASFKKNDMPFGQYIRFGLFCFYQFAGPPLFKKLF